MNKDTIQKILNDLAGHEERIRKLEKLVLTYSLQQKPKEVKLEKDKYTGPTGGVRFLIKNDLFKTKKGLSDIRKNLSDNGYYYSRQAVHEALKILSQKNGPLVSLKEGKGKLYVERK